MRSSTHSVLVLVGLSFSSWAQQADVTSIRLLAEKLHAAYAAKDLEALVSLWSDRSPEKASQREAA